MSAHVLRQVLEIDVVGQQYEQTVSADSFVDESSEVELECVPMGDDSDCEVCVTLRRENVEEGQLQK